MSEKNRKPVYSIVIVLALVCIAFGGASVWNSFKKFDNTIIEEKDEQARRVIMAEDANIETTLENFENQADALFRRRTFQEAERAWVDNNNVGELDRILDSKSITENSVYAGSVVCRNKKIIHDLSDENDFEVISSLSDNLLIVTSNEMYRAAYKHRSHAGIEYYLLISIENLINDVVGDEYTDDMTFIVDAKNTIFVYKSGETISVINIDTPVDKDVDKCKTFIRECQAEGISGTKSFEVGNGETQYTARMVVETVEDITNDYFAIGKVSNYDETIIPSRNAASEILFYGGIALLGVVLILMVLMLSHKRKNEELDNLRKKNETMEEINQKVQALAHHQRLETIGTMTSGIAHDFNNLLTPIMGYSMMTMEMLSKDQTDLQDNLMEVYNASMKAKEIVSRLADLSKKGDLETFVDINPDEILESSLSTTLPAKPDEIKVITDYNCGNDNIRGDRTQISQMLINLMLNAYDAMQDKEGILKLSTYRDGDKVVIKIRDNGEGMSSDTVSKIFDPFFTTKESGKGTGLGLAIVAQIAETHNAKVYVDSELGVGTEFKIVFDVV